MTLFVVFIKCVAKTEHNNRKFDKSQCCFYCDKLVSKIARHYLNVHKDGLEVAKIAALPFGKEREKLLEELRHKGNYYHNVKVLEKKSGQLIVARRPGPKEEVDPQDFLPCPHCLGFYRKKELWKHSKNCFFKTKKSNQENDEDGSDRIQERSKILLLSKLSPDSKEIVKVFASMKSDEVTIIATNDNLIKKYGELHLDRIGSERRHEVSQGMRQLARLLNQLNKVTDGASITLADYLKPQNFDHIITATRQLCSFDKVTEKSSKNVGVPSLALKLGHQIKKCIFVIQGNGSKKKGQQFASELRTPAKTFRRRME